MNNEQTSYTINNLRSSCKDISFEDFIKSYKQEFDDGYIILWQHHGVFIGELKKEKDVKWVYKKDRKNDEKKLKEVYKWTDKSNIVRIRAFDASKEVHIWRSSNGLTGRLRIDGEGDERDYVVTTIKLRSVIALALNHNNILDSDNLFVTTRNYIGYNSIGQAGYVDSRFLEITTKSF
jgi:hypothetical protein